MVQPRIYEALALQATVENQVETATHYLAQAQGLRESVLSYVLQGKHAELKGDLDGASDAYSEAFYMDTSLETYLLCENLVFHSNLKSIDYAMYARCILRWFVYCNARLRSISSLYPQMTWNDW